MLSIYTLKSASEASKYYQQGDYYTHESTDAHSTWMGKGAELLALQGRVDIGTFKNLLQGRLPSGDEMIQTKKGVHHRPGYDLTFSAPKSVSVLALVAGSKEVLQAHQEAVREVVTKIEGSYAACRIKKNGNISVEKTGNFLVAGFEHNDSRAGDPNLHTHCVLMNMTQKNDGAWRTLFADELYTDKLMNGMEYRSILAQKLMALGYALNLGKKGTFEITGVPEPVLNTFSKRRVQIEKWLEDKDVRGGEAAIVANFQTRTQKVNTSGEALKIRWENELDLSGSSLFELNKISENAKLHGPVKLPDPYVIAENSVASAIEHLSEKKSHFAIKEVIRAAKQMSLLSSSDGDFLKVIEGKIHNKELLYIEGKLLTTPKLFQLEAENTKSMLSGKTSVHAMLSRWIAKYVAKVNLRTETQQGALTLMLTSKDQQILVSSNSMTSLTDVLMTFNAICRDQGYSPRILTQKKTNIEKLAQKTGVERVSTIEGFLLSCEIRADKFQKTPNTLVGRLQDWSKRIEKQEARNVWIIDGDVSMQQINRLQQWSKHFRARIIFTQSINQPIHSLSSLTAKGLANINISAAQFYKADLKIRDHLLKNIESLEIKNAIQPISDYQERFKAAVELFTPASLLIAQTNAQVSELNGQVREKLIQSRLLSGEGIRVSTLQRIPLSVEEKRHLHLYNLNDVIRFNCDKPGTLVTKDSYFFVKNINMDRGVIELHNQRCDQVFWNPAKETMSFHQIEVYRAEKRELLLGDRLVWTRTLKNETDKSLDRIKDQVATVVGIDKTTISVALKSGKIAKLEFKDLKQQHWDHGYSVLLKNAEIGSFDNIALCLQSNKIDAKTIQDLQKLLSSVEESSKTVNIVCDNVETLKKTIEDDRTGNVSIATRPEIPYVRREALSDQQTTVTQQVFHGLQSEYLKARKLNPEFLEKNEPKLTANVSPEFRKACDVVDYVALYHSERSSVISLKIIKKDTYELAGILVPTKVIDGALELAIAKGWLVEVSKLEPQKNTDERLVCARHTIIMEKLCIKMMKEGQNTLIPIAIKSESLLKDIQMHPRLTDGQKDAVSLILMSSDKVVSVQGVAGAGKTTALRELKQRCQEYNFNTLVLANTGSARNQAQTASGIPSMTAAQFLTRVESLLTTDIDKARNDYGGNRVIILDESSLISTKDMFRLLTAVDKLDARLSIIGDFKQIGSIGAGEISKDLLAYGISKAAMLENVRLKDATAFEAMKQAYAGDMSKTIHTLRDSIEEIPLKSEALGRIVDIYTCLKHENREQTLIITPLNEDRNFVNQAIREKFKESKELQGEALKTRVFLQRDQHEIEKTNVFSYEVSDYIRFNTNHPRLGIKTGEYLKISEVDLKHHRLMLMFDNGERLYWTPKDLERTSDIEIYRKDERELMKNDTIIFKRNNESQGIFNGDKAKVLEVEGSLAKILLINGNTITLDLNKNENKHLDYGYALTAYAGQGRDVGFVLAYGDGPKPLSKKTSDLQVGDTIVLPKVNISKDELSYGATSRLVSVTAINNDELTFKDSNNSIHTVKAEKDKSWDYFPPFEARRDNELPLSTTQKSFLVQITRGDNLCLIVPNSQDFQKTLERHKGNEGSALRHLDPNWKDLNKVVERLVENIRGKAERKDSQISNHTDQGEVVKNSPLWALGKQELPSVVLSKSVEKKLSQTKLFTQQSQPRIDVNELENRLATDVLGYATRWLGPPSRVSGREARWGSKGSFSLTLSGSKAGVWSNFEVGKGGKGLVSLYKEIYDLEWKEAVKELARECGLQQREHISNRSLITKQPTKDMGANEANAQTKKIKYAQQEYKKAVSIKGTLAEKYLREERAISGKLPDDFRFRADGIHFDTKKKTPALIAPYRDKNNTIIGFVRVFLSPVGGKYQETFIDAKGKEISATRKANVGLSAKGSVVVQKGVAPTSLWVAEGIETALSISKAVPNETVVASLSASQLKNVPVGSDIQKVIICADNDPASSNTKKSVIEAVEFHLSEGRRVFIAIPSEMAGLKKVDFNDVLKQGGTPAVQKILNEMIEIKDINTLKIQEPQLSVTLQKIQAEQKKNAPDLQSEHPQLPLTRAVNHEIER
jgi:conjugative relaxase-like TrwC/TraI family protein